MVIYPLYLCLKKLYQQQTIDNLQTDLTITQNRIDTLLDMRIDMQITRDEYDRKNQELMIKQNNTAQMIKSHMDADAQFRFVVNAMICLCEDALGTFERSELDEQRKLMTLVFSELQISKDKPQITQRKPFNAMVNLTNCSEWLGSLDSNQGSWDQNPLPYRLATPQRASYFPQTNYVCQG